MKKNKNNNSVFKYFLVFTLAVLYVAYLNNRFHILNLNINDFLEIIHIQQPDEYNNNSNNFVKEKIDIYYFNKSFVEENQLKYQNKISTLIDQNFDSFFYANEENIDKLVEELLSLRTKWRLLKGYFSKNIEKENIEYFNKLVKETLLPESELLNIYGNISANLSRLINEHEYEIVKTFKKTSNIYLDDKIDIETLKSSIDNHFFEIEEININTYNVKDAKVFIGSIIVGELLTTLTISSGILGISTLTTWETFGIGLIIGWGVDVIINKIWDTEGQLKENITYNYRQLIEKLKISTYESSYNLLKNVSSSALVVFKDSLNLTDNDFLSMNNLQN